MATLIVAPEPQDINIVQRGLELLRVKESIESAGISWQGTSALQMVEGITFGIWQNVTSVRQLLSVATAVGVVLPSRGTYRFLADRDHDLRNVLRVGIQVKKTRPSDLLILDESVNERTGRRMEGTSLVHSTTRRGRVLGHCLLNAFHAGAEVSGFVNFEMKMNRKTKAGYRPRGHPTREVARALNTPLRALALSLIDSETARGNQSRTLVTDSGFLSLPFCRRLRRRGWHWIIAGKVNTPIEYQSKKTTLEELFAGKRSTKPFGDSARYRVFDVVYPGYGPVRAFFIRFVDRHGDWHELYLLTDLTKKRASARSVLRKYLRRWDIELGHRQTKETFNLRGYHGQTLHGHINFYALVLLAHQVAEAVLHDAGVREGETEVKVATLALRARLATMRLGATSKVATRDTTQDSRLGNCSNSRTMMGTTFPSLAPPQTMMGCGLR